MILSSLLILTVLVGCGTSPKIQLYTLNSIERDASSENNSSQNIVIKVGPVSIADMLDQDPIVSRTGSNSLVADEFNRWGGNLKNDIRRIIGENISILVPNSQMTLGNETMLLPIDYQVIINVREFDGQLGGKVILNVDWTVARKGKYKKVMVKKSVLYENAIGITYQDYVAAQSRLLEKLSHEISTEIGKLIK
jgi:uncharacterized protein